MLITHDLSSVLRSSTQPTSKILSRTVSIAHLHLGEFVTHLFRAIAKR